MKTTVNENSKAIIENQALLNQVVDYYKKNNILLEIVTCNEKINDGQYERFGRFNFDYEKQKIMIRRNGHYLLIVRNGTGIVDCRLISANDIGERKIVSWKEFFN